MQEKQVRVTYGDKEQIKEHPILHFKGQFILEDISRNISWNISRSTLFLLMMTYQGKTYIS